MKIFITSGGTKVPIDSVRHLANMSKGTFGSKIAMEAMKRGHQVSYMVSKEGKKPFSIEIDIHREFCFEQNEINIAKKFEELSDLLEFYRQHKDLYHFIEYDTFLSYYNLLKNNLRVQKSDVVILSAAVSDYGVENAVDGKIQSKLGIDIKLVPLPKVINQIKEWLMHPADLKFLSS